MFRIAKQMRKDKRDVVGINFIKSDTGEIKVGGLRFLRDERSTLKGC